MELELFETSWINRGLKRFGHAWVILGMIGVVWLPLVVLSLLSSRVPVLDVATHVRTFISLPLFMISYTYVAYKMKWTIIHFDEALIIKEKDREKFLSIIDSSRRLARSRTIKIIIFLLVYVMIFYEHFLVSPSMYIEWRSIQNPAGKWFYLVSHPVYYYIFISFLFRTFLWWRFMFKVSMLDLRLWAAHGDGVGGLGFLSTMLNAFVVPALAMSSSAAGAAANLILFGKLGLPDLKMLTLIFSSALVVIFVGPLFLFVPAILKARVKFIHEYGKLSAKQMKDFYEKWLEPEQIPADELSVADFSAITDYGTEVTRVHNMKLLPIKITDLAVFILAAIVPFLPVFSLEMPWQVIFKQIFEMVH